MEKINEIVEKIINGIPTNPDLTDIDWLKNVITDIRLDLLDHIVNNYMIKNGCYVVKNNMEFREALIKIKDDIYESKADRPKIVPTWSNTFNSKLNDDNYAMLHEVFEVAKNAGYPFVCWNDGRVYYTCDSTVTKYVLENDKIVIKKRK